MQLNLTVRQLVILGKLLEEAADKREKWIASMHTSPEERAKAREELVVIRSIQGEN